MRWGGFFLVRVKVIVVVKSPRILRGKEGMC